MAYAPESVRTVVDEIFEDIPYQSVANEDNKLSGLLVREDGLQVEARVAHGYDFENFEQLNLYGLKIRHIDSSGVFDQESCVLVAGNLGESVDCIRIILSSLFMTGIGRFREMKESELGNEFLKFAEIIRS